MAIDDGTPHIAAPARCWFCGHEWMAVYPAPIHGRALECPGCGLLVGFPVDNEADDSADDDREPS